MEKLKWKNKEGDENKAEAENNEMPSAVEKMKNAELEIEEARSIGSKLYYKAKEFNIRYEPIKRNPKPGIYYYHQLTARTKTKGTKAFPFKDQKPTREIFLENYQENFQNALEWCTN